MHTLIRVERGNRDRVGQKGPPQHTSLNLSTVWFTFQKVILYCLLWLCKHKTKLLTGLKEWKWVAPFAPPDPYVDISWLKSCAKYAQTGIWALGIKAFIFNVFSSWSRPKIGYSVSNNFHVICFRLIFLFLSSNFCLLF